MDRSAWPSSPHDASTASRLRGVTHMLLDVDGTLLLGGRLLPATPRFLDTLASLGIGYTCLTNNAARSSHDLLAHLRTLGLALRDEQLITPTQIALAYLRRQRPPLNRLFVLGTPTMQGELAAAGVTLTDHNPLAVLVSFDQTLTYDRLCQAAWWIRQGLPFLATHPDVACPTDRPTVLVDCGAICQSLTAATGVTPTWLGKPSAHVLPEVTQRTDTRPDALAMVGDRLATDIALADATGMMGILTLSGDASAEDVPASPWQPDLVVRDVGELADRLIASRR